MYTSLDKVDIVATSPNGLKQYVQTDHRTAKEVELSLDLSVAFALGRVLVGKLMAKGDAAKSGSSKWAVVYHANELPPEAVRRAIRAAGGQLTVGRPAALVVDREAPPPLEKVLDSALVGLARAVAVEYKVSLTIEGLTIAENRLVEVAGDRKRDEVAYWSAVLKLGSLCGEYLRACSGGKWIASEMFVPAFALETRAHGGNRSHVNLFGKAVKRFRPDGEADTVVGMVRMITSQP